MCSLARTSSITSALLFLCFPGSREKQKNAQPVIYDSCAPTRSPFKWTCSVFSLNRLNMADGRAVVRRALCGHLLRDYQGRLAMHLSYSSRYAAPPALALLLSLSLAMPAQAAQSQAVGPTDKACQATSVSDDGKVLGYCVSGKAWLANNPTTHLELHPLEVDQSCTSSVLSDRLMTGNCNRANAEPVPVYWTASNTSALPIEFKALALSGTVAPGSKAKIIGANRSGHVVGNSINSLGALTAVVWPPESKGNAEPVSALNDNCVPVDVSDVTGEGRPAIALNCPDSKGSLSAKVAFFREGKYALSGLPVPKDASSCTVKAININNQLAGTCFYPDRPSEAAFWPFFDEQPQMWLSKDKLGFETVFLNDKGVSVVYANAPGKKNLPILRRGADNSSVQVPFPTGFQVCTVNGLAKASEKLFMTCFSNDLNVPVQAFSWTSADGAPTAVQALPGTGDNRATAISPLGTFGAGYAKVAAGQIKGVRVQLP